jgi:hypothetical protein
MESRQEQYYNEQQVQYHQSITTYGSCLSTSFSPAVSSTTPTAIRSVRDAHQSLAQYVEFPLP